MKNNFRFIFIPAFVLLFAGNTFSQIITSNDGFEGTPTHHVPPPGWNNCEDGNSSVDTQPGPLHNMMPASQGATYVSLVAREINPPGTVETVWADLLTPFKKDHCYTLMLDLTLSHEFYGTLDWIDYYFNNPCRLQILGLNGECESTSQTELLWQSDVIDHFEWQNYEISIRPESATFDRIALRVAFTEPGNFKNSALMIDNLRYKEVTGYITDNCDMLTLPSGATMINWSNNGILLDQHDIQLPISESGHYGASFYNSDSCFIITSGDFNVSGPDTVYITKYVTVYDTVYLPGELNPLGLKCYPNPTSDHVTIEYLSSKNDFCSISVNDNTGREILSVLYNLNSGNNTLLVPMENLATGIYFIVFTLSNDKKTIFKVVKGNF